MSRWPGLAIREDRATGRPVLALGPECGALHIPLDGDDVARLAEAVAKWEREHAARSVLDEKGRGTVVIGGLPIRVLHFPGENMSLSWAVRVDSQPPGDWFHEELGDSLGDALARLLTDRCPLSGPGTDLQARMTRAFALTGPAPRQGGKWKAHVLRAMMPLMRTGPNLSDEGWTAVLSGFYDVAFAAGRRTRDALKTPGPSAAVAPAQGPGPAQPTPTGGDRN